MANPGDWAPGEGPVKFCHDPACWQSRFGVHARHPTSDERRAYELHEYEAMRGIVADMGGSESYQPSGDYAHADETRKLREDIFGLRVGIAVLTILVLVLFIAEVLRW